MIDIRFLNANELQWAVNTANEVFETCVRGYIRTQEELTQYYSYVQVDNLWQEMSAGRLFLWGVFEDSQMCAVSAMQNTGHITMLYVRTQFQRRRMGTQLLNGMAGYAASALHINRITINVMPAEATPYFYRRGFVQLPNARPNQSYVSLEYPLVQIAASTFQGYSSGSQPGMPGYGTQPGAQPGMPGYGTQPGAQPGMPGYSPQGGMPPVQVKYRVTYPTRAVSPKVVLIITAVVLLLSLGIGSGLTIRHMVRDGMLTQSDFYEDLPEGLGNVKEL